MEIENNSSLTFQSNIKFVSPRFYKYKTGEMFKQKNCEIIGNWEILPKTDKKDFYAYRTNMNLGFTNRVRTCTAGIVANKGNNASLFMHVLNSSDNLNYGNLLKKYFQGTNAILIGSKNGFTHSPQVFEKLQKFALNNHLPLTVMKGLNKIWEANLAYCSDEDTLYLCVNNIINPSEYINKPPKLKKVFRKVQISPKDNVEYLSRFQELLLMVGLTFENLKRTVNLFHKK